jgi:hypothetical protein
MAGNAGRERRDGGRGGRRGEAVVMLMLGRVTLLAGLDHSLIVPALYSEELDGRVDASLDSSISV